MNRYEYKQERRRERLEARAERLRREGQARIDSGMTRLRAIPFGQPILIGHYSEQRDRNYRRKAIAAVDKGFALQKEATDTARRAEAVGTGGVSSDDPEAVKKLREQLEPLEKLQAVMVAANKVVRRFKEPSAEAIAAAVAAGVPERKAAELWQPDFCGRIGFASYQLTNNSANIRRIKQRIEALGRRPTEDREQTIGEVRLVENAEANRVQLFFPGKPSAEARRILKTWGFRWSPSEGAWQRQLHTRAVWCAQEALKEIGKLKQEA